MSFKVGDRVRIVLASAAPHLLGADCTIIAYHDILGGYGLYETDITHPIGGNWTGTAECFRKIGDDYEPGSWAEIEKLTRWSPMKVTA